MESGDWLTAESHLHEAVATCPVDPDARRHYAETLWHRGDREDSLEEIDAAVRLAADDPQLLLRAASMRLELGRHDEALQRIEQAIGLNPRIAPAWTLRGRVKENEGRFREALADYHRAASLDRESRDALLGMAEAHRKLNQPERALASLHCLADLYTPGEEPAHVHYLMGLAYTALRRYDEAVECLARASHQGPSSEVLFRVAEAEALANRPRLATAALRQALAIDPHHGPSRTLLDQVETAQRTGRNVH